MTAAKPEDRRLPIWLPLLATWVLIQAMSVAIGATPVFEGNLIDPDSYMRLVRVDLLHETGAWFDGRIPRSNAPYGDTLHWTRPFDLLVLAAAWPMVPLFGFEGALFWGGAWVSPLLLLAAGATMIWAARPVIGSEARPYLVLIFMTQLSVVSYSLPGRVDHHTLQILLAVASVGLVLRLSVRPQRKGPAVLAGLVLGLGLWVSVEFILVVLLVMAALWLSWLRHGHMAGAPALGLAGGLAGSLVLALLSERPAAAFLAVEYDRVSVVFLVVALLHLLFWLLALWAEQRAAVGASLRRRVLASLAWAVVSAAVIEFLFPSFFLGGTVNADPEFVRVFLSRVRELQPLAPVDGPSWGRFLAKLGTPAAGLLVALAMTWIRRREDEATIWAFFALGLGVYLALSIQHLRFAALAQVLAVIPLTYLLSAIQGRLARISDRRWRAVAPGLAALVVIFGVPVTGLSLGYGGVVEKGTVVAAGAAPGQAASRRKDCSISAIAAYLDRPETFGDRSRIVAAQVNYGSELLYRTRHGVVATPYHRNVSGILDIYRLFSSIDPEQSRAIVDARGIELLLLCPSPAEAAYFTPPTPGATLYERLLDGRSPSWVTQVSLPHGLAGPFRLFQIVR